MTFNDISNECIPNVQTEKKRERVKDQCCRQRSVGDTDLLKLATTDECTMPEVPETDNSDCLNIHDCCVFDQWTSWSECELPDGRRLVHFHFFINFL